MTATPPPRRTPTPEPLPTPDGVVRRLRVPILMYHYLSAPPPDADALRRGLSVSPEQFEEHLRYLKQAGYETISLHDLALALQIGHPLPERPIIITFDDGYRDNYEQAFPLLMAYGFTATFFLITGFIDAGKEAYVTWDQVIEMHEAGMEMEAHGHTHPDLRGRDVDYLVWQVLGAKEAIEARTGVPVRFFSYPAGKYDELVIRVLHSAHYWGAVTVNPGVEHTSDRMFELSRVRVPGGLTAAGLAATLDAYMNAP
jgi:peptidoglycan/xylan/chitin deacetylase (PgdA/CDA1 family)